VLLEWLDGPSLGDLSRGGRDVEAGVELLATACRLHAALSRQHMVLPTLSEWFQGLFTLRFGPTCPSEVRVAILRATAIAAELLASADPPQPLHGDLHHDNIRGSPRGYLAFDAKGVLGEPGYEFANAFRNPKGAPHLVRDPARIARLADLWSEGIGLPRQRLLQWAAAKCALSIAWRSGPVLQQDPEIDLLTLLLRFAES
jgi:streptomycin 6-kinase